MMRKITVMVLLTLYSTITIGVPLHFHYCSGELQHITLFKAKECDSHDNAGSEDSHKAVTQDQKDPSSCCQAKSTSLCIEAFSEPDCCDNQTELLQLDQSATALVLVKGDDVQFALICEYVDLPHVQQKEDVKGDPIDPLPPKPVLAYIEHCSLIFYG